jgi:hypothetical protein
VESHSPWATVLIARIPRARKRHRDCKAELPCGPGIAICDFLHVSVLKGDYNLVGCVASTVFGTNGMFYGLAEMANWRPFRHFTKSGKSLKTVDATHPRWLIVHDIGE